LNLNVNCVILELGYYLCDNKFEDKLYACDNVQKLIVSIKKMEF